MPGASPPPGPAGECRLLAADLSDANGWHVLNLACNGATIRRGLLGPQKHHRDRLAPQLAVAERAGHASVVIVSVGADDLNWSAMLRYCAVTPRCDDRATERTSSSSSLRSARIPRPASQLAALPSHPQVIVNRYYDPFGTQPGCLSQAGLPPRTCRR